MRSSPPRPRVRELVPDPFTLSRRQRATAVIRPLVGLALYIWCATQGWWLLAALMVVVVFITDAAVMHDAIHRAMGFGDTGHGLLTGLGGLLILNAGHALAITHRHHHRVYPSTDDPESYVDGMPLWRALLESPRYRFRLWAWAWRHRGAEGRVIALEMGTCVALWTAAVVTLPWSPALGVYVGAAEIGAWLFPILAVIVVHDGKGSDYLRQTRTTRSRSVAAVLLGMQYHLEHHLFPRVPTARLAEVANAFDSWAASHDVVPTRIGRRTRPRG